MRIGIDARFLTHPQPGGFKTYTENLVAGLSQVDDRSTYILYLDRYPSNGALPVRANFDYRIVTGALPPIGMPLREQVLLPHQVAKDKIDLMHFPCLTGSLRSPCPYVLTLHDTMWLSARFGSLGSRESRSPRRWVMWLYHRWVPLWAVHRARAVITISKAAKADIVEQLRISPDKVTVVYVAAKSVFRQCRDVPRLEAVCRQYGLSRPFILSIGSAVQRKNLRGLVLAYSRLPSSIIARYQLAIVWTHDLLKEAFVSFVRGLGIGERIRHLRSVPDDDLALLYNAASLFVFPSLYEGFGLPPLEAMACGTPVVAGDNSSIPEVAGEAAVLVDSRDNDEVAAGINLVLGNEALRAQLIEKGLKRAATFSWEKCARETLSVYRGALLR